MPSRDKPQVNYGEAIKRMRVIRGLSQHELGMKAGLGRSHVSLIEKGRRLPSLQKLESIARALEMSMCVLMFIAENGP